MEKNNTEFLNLCIGAMDGVQVENTKREIVGIKELLQSEAFQAYNPKKLMYVVGKNVEGEIVVDNLAHAPHVLIAGSPGSGARESLNVMLASLMMKYTPEEMRFILVDSQLYNFEKFQNSPHLLVNEIFTNTTRALCMLDFLQKEIDRRCGIFSSYEVIDLGEYNDVYVEGKMEKFPRIVVVLNEIADFMNVKSKLDDKIFNLINRARICGIHLVLASQRHLLDVITGTIKAKIPTKMAFKVEAAIHSRVIIDLFGCEKLLGNGDMFFRNSFMPDYVRCQGAYISNKEMKSVLQFIKENYACNYNEEILKEIDSAEEAEKEIALEKERKEAGRADEVYLDAVKLVVKNKTVMTSELQACLAIGYPIALKLMMRLTDEGVIDHPDGQRSIKVIMTEEEAKKKYGF